MQSHIICQKVIACEIIAMHVSVRAHMIEERMEGESSGIVNLTAMKTEASTENHPETVICISCYWPFLFTALRWSKLHSSVQCWIQTFKYAGSQSLDMFPVCGIRDRCDSLRQRATSVTAKTRPVHEACIHTCTSCEIITLEHALSLLLHSLPKIVCYLVANSVAIATAM